MLRVCAFCLIQFYYTGMITPACTPPPNHKEQSLINEYQVIIHCWLASSSKASPPSANIQQLPAQSTEPPAVPRVQFWDRRTPESTDPPETAARKARIPLARPRKTARATPACFESSRTQTGGAKNFIRTQTLSQAQVDRWRKPSGSALASTPPL